MRLLFNVEPLIMHSRPLHYWAWLDRKVVSAFNARKWELPARIYANPLEIYRDFAVRLAPVTVEEAERMIEQVMLGYATSPADLARGRSVDALRTGDFVFALKVADKAETLARLA